MRNNKVYMKKIGKHMVPFCEDEYGFLYQEEPDPEVGNIVMIFVYGSLKKNHKHNFMLGRAEFLENVKTKPNYLLYDTGPYPGMIEVRPGEGRSIEGELYSITKEDYENLNKHVPFGFKNREIHLVGKESQIISLLYKQGVDRFPDCGTSWPSD